MSKMLRDLLAWGETFVDDLKHLTGRFLAWVDALLSDPGMLRDPNMLLWAGIVLVVVWIVSALVVRLADAVLHMALILGILLVVSWVVLTYIV